MFPETHVSDRKVAEADVMCQGTDRELTNCIRQGVNNYFYLKLKDVANVP